MPPKASRMRARILRRLAGATLLQLLALVGPETLALTASAEEAVTFPAGGRDTHAYLTRPEGRGPFPAVILLHSCLGLPANRRAIESEIAGWGYLALFVDDFSGRGVKETCAVDFPDGLPDAYGALTFLSGLAAVDPSRIAAIGFSQGADTALSIAASEQGSRFPPGLAFRAAAAFYPPCANQSGARLRIPILILIGGEDAVTPAADCERLAKSQPGDVELVVLPGAGHGFDLPEFRGGRRVLSMWLSYDPDAAKRSWAELRRFLAKRLAR
jgi:dienelactone hydrolase